MTVFRSAILRTFFFAIHAGAKEFSKKMVKNQMSSRLSDSNSKNCLVISTAYLTPNITSLVKPKQGQKSH